MQRQQRYSFFVILSSLLLVSFQNCEDMSSGFKTVENMAVAVQTPGTAPIPTTAPISRGPASENVNLKPIFEGGCDCVNNGDDTTPCAAKSLTKTFKQNVTKRPNSKDSIYNWEFTSGGDYAYCGRFANGDYWIAPKNGEQITITSIRGNGLNIGAELNPTDPAKTGLFGSGNRYGNYDSSKNIIDKLPLVVTNTQNNLIVAAIQRDEATTGNCGTSAIVGSCVDSYNFITILPRIPQGQGLDFLRPSISSGLDKLYKLSDFNFNRLELRSEFDVRTAASFASVANRWSGTFEFFREYSEGGRAFRSHILVDDYATGLASAWHNDMVAVLNSKNTFAEKKSALAAMLTYGKDNYYIFQDKNGPQVPWGSGAGQHTGRIPPVLLFASLVKNPEIAEGISQISKMSSGKPQEFEQIISGGPNGLLWGDVPPEGEKRYWSDLFGAKCYDGATGTCGQTLGKKTSMDPYKFIDGPGEKPGTQYFLIGLGAMSSIAAEMWLMPTMCDIADNETLIPFYERAVTQGVQVSNDPCAPPDPREASNCNPYYDGTTTPTHCVYYKVTWGPDLANPGQCIKNNSGGNIGQNGRFPNLVGTPVGISYQTWDLYLNYNLFKNNRTSCRSKPRDVILIPSDAHYDSASKKLSLNMPSTWTDGSAFDSSKYLGWFKISYQTISGKTSQVTTSEATLDLSQLGVASISKVEVCDHINRCQVMLLK